MTWNHLVEEEDTVNLLKEEPKKLSAKRLFLKIVYLLTLLDKNQYHAVV